MDNARFYVYQYVTETGDPYYIGKGTGNRMNVKHKHVQTPAPEFCIKLKDGLTNEQAKQLEGELISKYKRKVDGGILDNTKLNQWACFTGWQHSDSAKKAISEKNTGKRRTEEQKQNYRKPKSAAHIEKIKQANLGRKDDGRNAKISQTMKGRPWSEARRLAHALKSIKV